MKPSRSAANIADAIVSCSGDKNGRDRLSIRRAGRLERRLQGVHSRRPRRFRLKRAQRLVQRTKSAAGGLKRNQFVDVLALLLRR